MPDRVRTPNAVDALPDQPLAELRALLGDRLLLGERERRERASDWWPLSKVWAVAGDVAALPAAVVLPDSEEELRAVLALCTRERIPVTPSAGRSSVCGQSVPVAGGVVLDLERLNGIVALDEA